MKKLRLRKEVKESIAATMFGIFLGIALIGALMIGNYRYDEFAKKSTVEVPVQTVQSNNR